MVFMASMPLILHTKQSSKKSHNVLKPEPKDVWITVFVHGIMSIKPHLNMSNFMRFMQDDIGNTVYENTVELMRLDPFFYKNQAMQGFGLIPVTIDDASLTSSANAMAKIYDQVTEWTKKGQEKNYYYTFGWSALLSPSMRYFDAKDLFDQLVDEIEKFKQKGITPKVRLVGYSHGGNVCLNVAAIRQDFYPLSPLSIDELILIGIPIQTENDYLVSDQIFKKVYSFYSDGDRIQQIDCFAFNRFFSRKTFKNRRFFKVPSKVTQINLKIMRTVNADCCIKDKKIRLAGNFDDPSIISGTSHLLRDVSAGHIELWFFGWAPQHYRKNFILKPLPVFVFIPRIIHYIELHKDKWCNPASLIVDMRPEHEKMIIKQYKHGHSYAVVPFATKKEFEILEKTGLKSQPDSYTAEEYEQHIRDSFDKAVQMRIESDLVYIPHYKRGKTYKSRMRQSEP